MQDKISFKLTELVPLKTLEQIQTMFEATVGVPMTFTDETGMSITPIKNPLCFCGTLVHTTKADTVCLRRVKWDEPEDELEHEIRSAHNGSGPIAHRCMGGFRDMAVPVIVEDQTIGFAVFARSLITPPDVEGFRAMAVDSSMSPEVGEAVAQNAVVMPAERVKQIANFLQVITGLVVQAAYEQLRARQVMELEKLRDSLIHMIVHDMRTPLTGIMTGLETIIDLEYEEEVTQEFVPLALRSSQMLLEMVNTLLDINKIESGQMKLNLAEVDFDKIMGDALEQVRGIAVSRNQELTARKVTDNSKLVADEEKIRRVLINLLGNALKFTQDGGQIEVIAFREDDKFCFSVSDNGLGIPVEFQEKVFDKFGQVEGKSAGRKNSTGLGLTFCKMVAEAHGGTIHLKSEEGKGSSFTVCLPVNLTVTE